MDAGPRNDVAPPQYVEEPMPQHVGEPPMHPHWGTPGGSVASILFKGLCIVSFGRLTLEHTWNVIQVGRNTAWKEEKEALIARINNMNVVVCDLGILCCCCMLNCCLKAGLLLTN